jgi:curved DNA-binding protein CbpA
MNKKEAIELLNLPKNWTNQDVRKQYKKKALEYHPDRNSGFASKFIKLKEAHDLLLNTNLNPKDSSFHNELDELINAIMKQYKDAIVPFVLSLPSEKQKWIKHFLELYGLAILGDDNIRILEELNFREERYNIDLSNVIYIDEIIRDQVIIQQNEYIPSWVLEWNGKSIHRNKTKDIELSKENLLTFFIPKSIKNIYNSSETIQLNRSYFSGSNIIHIKCNIQKNDLRITADIQFPKFEMECFTIYNSNGKVIWTHKENGFKGCIHPSVGIDDFQIRTPYRIGIQLTL